MSKEKILTRLIENFCYDYENFINKLKIDNNLINKINDVDIQFTNDIKSINYDNEKIEINYDFIYNEDFKFHFYKCLIGVLSSNKEEDYIYNGICVTKNEKKLNNSFNDMLSNYICNAMSGTDIDDNKCIFMPMIENIIGSEKLVDIYFNNDITLLFSDFKNIGVDFTALSAKFDEFDYYANKKYDNNCGTEIYKTLATAMFVNSKKNNMDVNIDSISSIVEGEIGFTGIRDTDNLYEILFSTYDRELYSDINKTF